MDELPAIGLGTWENTDPDVCTESVRTAIEMGYRHIDTAQYYGNEESVGEGIAAADVPREEVVVATKVHAEKFGLAHDEVIEGFEVSLDRLGLEYLDLLYVHWPVGNYDAAETMPAFDELVDRGLIDHVGVSNFTPELLDEAIETCPAPIAAHQFELHPFLPQSDLVERCQDRDVTVVGYSPLARGAVLDDPTIDEIADEHGVSEAQVSLAWLRQRDVVAIPKATSAEHVHDNWASLHLEIDEEDVARIDAIDRRDRRVDPSFAPWN